jgi:glucose/arabinose dehydrogenase
MALVEGHHFAPGAVAIDARSDDNDRALAAIEPFISLGRDYAGPWQGKFAQDGMEPAAVNWVPSIAVAGLLFCSGDRFPAWRNHAIVGAMRLGEIPNTGHIQRIVCNENGDEIRREMMLTELRQRVREVRQGPDGLIYLLTDEADGAVLKLEPAP